MYLFYMKIHISVCVDVEIAKQLQKEKNKSALINSLLKEHFRKQKK